MGGSLEDQIADIAALTPSALRQRFTAVFGKDPARRASRELLRLALAHRLQEEALGGLSALAKRQLTRLEGRIGDGKPVAPAPRLRIKPGTRLVRLWKGERHTVTVIDHGFEHCGMRYPSLSVIAREITGTRWSGPVFFGLKRRRKGATHD